MFNRSKNFLVAAGILVTLLLAGPGSRPARAHLINFEVMGGVNDTINSGGAVGFLGGAGLSIGLVPMVHFEVDGLYLSRSFNVGPSLGWVQIPALLRFHIMPQFSLGIGGYVDIPVNTLATSNDGIVGSARFKIPAAPLFLEGRFNLGLTQINGSGINDVQGMIGLIF